MEELSKMNDADGKDKIQLNRSDLDKDFDNNKRSLIKAIMIAIMILAVIIVVTGIALIASKHSMCQESRKSSIKESSKSSKISSMKEYCAYSEEAQRIGLGTFLKKVQKSYFDNYPNQVGFQPDLAREDIQKRFFPYDPRPEVLKRKTDAARALLDEINSKQFDPKKMKPKENRVISQVKHFLQQNFGTPYDENFYSGDWMLGPNYFCWMPICYLGYDINALGVHSSPKSAQEIKAVITKIMAHKQTVDNYIANMKLGIKAGMVRAKIDCKAGLDAIKNVYKTLSINGKPESVMEESFASKFVRPAFYSKITKAVNDTWIKDNNGKTTEMSIRTALIDGCGKPILNLINYLQFNHSLYCLPNHISSGLGNLPVDYIYYNGTRTNQKTTRTLPITNTKLSGKVTYEKILPYFTTSNISADEIYKEGQRQLDYFYPKAVEIAKNITNITETEKAIEEFRKIIDGPDQWHGELKFPENESNKKAYKTCHDAETAKKYCPVRWRSIMKWADYIRDVMAITHPKLTPFFHFTGDKTTVPNCPIEMWPHYNPSNGAMYFQRSDENCLSTTKFGLPFFLEKYGPKFQEWSVIGHEARPGHHIQMQGTVELFRDKCGGVESWIDEQGYYVVFTEGWALYGENPVLSDDVNLYADNMMQKYGMIKWQVWRAVRLIVDTGLHYRGMNMTWARDQFSKYTWDKTDFARKEVTRYMSDPGQATAYMLGRLAILEMRKKATKELGKQFDLKDFHYQLLSQSSSPVDYLKDHIDRYIECKKDETLPMCEYILTPVDTIPEKKKQIQNYHEQQQQQLLKPIHRQYV